MSTVCETASPASVRLMASLTKTASSDALLPRTSQPTGAGGMLGRVFRTYWGRILFTYGLFNLENLLRLLQPLALGMAINDLLHGSSVGLVWLVVQLLAFMLIGAVRRMYDMRAFTGIYTDLVTGLVNAQRRQNVGLSRVSARSTLSRAFVEFFERDVPVVVQAIYSVGGALVMLLFYDPMLVVYCLVLLVPATAINMFYSRKTTALTAGLNDQLEQEVDVLSHGSPDKVNSHYRGLARWRIRLADWEALNFGVMELFILGLLAAALLRACASGAEAGTILAVFRYVLMFVLGLDSVPMIVQQMSRLRDVGRRMNETADRPAA